MARLDAMADGDSAFWPAYNGIRRTLDRLEVRRQAR
jgi:hypothetical protein